MLSATFRECRAEAAYINETRELLTLAENFVD